MHSRYLCIYSRLLYSRESTPAVSNSLLPFTGKVEILFHPLDCLGNRRMHLTQNDIKKSPSAGITGKGGLMPSAVLRFSWPVNRRRAPQAQSLHY